MMKPLRIATRGSALAQTQAKLVQTELEALGIQSELVIVKTKGDLDQTSPLREIGGDGLFVRGVEEALLRDQADLAVHSGKDLPFQLMDELMIAAVLIAADPGDCLISLPETKVIKTIGTGSARRIAQYQRLDPTATFVSIRGNVQTRLNQLHSGACDAVILAKAGLARLELDLQGYTVRDFTPEDMIPAACQGIIAIECRRNDLALQRILEQINHAPTWQRFQIERRLFCLLEANCSQAVGVHAQVMADQLVLHAILGDKQVVRRAHVAEYDQLCQQIKQEMES